MDYMNEREKEGMLETAKEIVSEYYEKDDENYPTLVLGCYGMLSEFGMEYSDEIQRVFGETDIIIEDKSMKDLLIDNDKYGNQEQEVIEDEQVMGASASYQGHIVNFDDDHHVMEFDEGPSIICSKKNSSSNKTLIRFTHEANHIFEGLNNGFGTFAQDRGYYVRTGFDNYYRGYNINEQMINGESGNTFNELINVLVTSEEMKNIKDSENIIKNDPELGEFYSSLDLEELDKPLGYSSSIFGDIENLWNNPTFKQDTLVALASSNTYHATIDFNKNVNGDDKSFDNYMEAWDTLYNPNSSKDSCHEALDLIRANNNSYNQNTLENVQENTQNLENFVSSSIKR